MTLQQLRYVVTTAENGSISKAAKKLFITQPTLTKAIKSVENEIKITIFTRTNRGIEVSNEGNEFLGYAKQVLYHNDLLEKRYLA